MEWQDVVTAQRNKENEIARKQRHRRAMWEELGFAWSPSGPLGDICLGMIRLMPEQVEVFEKELSRRCEAERLEEKYG